MKHKFKPREANQCYEKLQEYAKIRKKEISQIFEPYIKISDKYGRLISRLTLLLGNVKPRDIQDIVIRDLMADIFDCLYESRELILAGKLNVAFPIARRAYESLSLLHLCMLDKKWAEQWQRGKKIENSEIRKGLSNHPMGETYEKLKELYDFFCSATHPNRGLIPRRFLGEGNEYVLGVIGRPDLLMMTDYCIKILEMWFWLAATISYFNRETLLKLDKGYFEFYSKVAKEAQEVNQWLVDNFNNLLSEAQEYWRKNPVEE